MDRLLNRGLNFCILPFKLDITQTLVEYKRFERSAIWWEFHYGKENDQNYEDPIFKKMKTNLPKNYSVPDGLKVFLSSVKSGVLDPRNRNSVPRNILQVELLALKELQELQRKRKNKTFMNKRIIKKGKKNIKK